MGTRRFQPWLAPLLYLAVGAIWISFSDQLVELMSRDAAQLTKLQTWKGWAFVALTCVMAFVLVRQAMRESDRIVEAEGQVRAILDTPSVFLGLLDPEGRVLHLNATARAATEADGQDLVGRLFWEGSWFRHDATVRTRIRELIERAARGEHPPPVRVTVIDGALRIRHVEFSCSRAPRPDRRTRWLVTTGRDISDEVASSAALAESESRFRTVADNAPLMLWLSDSQGRKTYFNRRWYEFTGRPEESELGSGWMHSVHPDDAEPLPDIIGNALARQASFSIGFRLRRKDGVWRRMVCHAEPLINNLGEFKGHVGTVVDVTESRLLAETARADAERQRLLLDITRLILESPTIDAALTDQVFLAIRSHFDLDFCLNYRADPATNGLVLVTSLGFDPIEMPPPQTLSLKNADDAFLPLRWEAAAAQARLALNDLELYLSHALGQHAAICHPLQAADGSMLGVIGFGSRRRTEFNAAEKAFFQTLCYFIGIAWERERSARALSDSERRFRRAIASAPFPIVIHAENGEILSVNDTWLRLTGYSRAELTTVEEWVRRAYGEEVRERVSADISRLYTIKGPLVEGEYVIRCANGEERTWEFSSAPLGRTQDGRRLVISAAADVTERRESEARATFLAQHDTLTKLPNRILAHDRLTRAIGQAQRAGTQVALMFLDIDNFKSINDTLGHSVGDELLKAMAVRLEAVVRDTDTVSRQGGDEFLLILHDVQSLDAVARIGQKLIEEIARPLDLGNIVLDVTGSVGIAIFPNDAFDIDDLMRKADMAMYQAKDAGRNNYRFYADWMNASTMLQISLRNDLSGAMERGEFSLAFQPQFSLHDYGVVGAEALLRWNSPTRGQVSPDTFISVAEESGLMESIGTWVLQAACSAAAEWQRSGTPPLTVAVNVSAVQFRRANFVDNVKHALDLSGLAPELLELELTESALLKQMDNSARTLRRIRDLGVRLSLDDFGTGHTSVATLKRFDVDRLKIDRSLIRDMTTKRESDALVQTIVKMAHAFGVKALAEGLETEEALHLLQTHECDEVQGFLFACPMPREAFETFMKNAAKPDTLFAGHGNIRNGGQ